MSVSIVSRRKWGARPWNGTPSYVSLSRRTEFFVHYDGGTPVHRTGYDVPRAIERVHMNQGWSGVGYNFVIDQDGRIYEGRGWTKQGAHCPSHNVSGIGVQIAIGGNQEPSAKALAACRALYDEACRRTGRRLAKKGHRDGFATACPGPKLYAWVKAGMPAGGYDASSGGGSSKPAPSPSPSVARYQVTINGLKYGYGAKGDHVTEVGKALVKRGHGDHYKVGPGPKWSDADTKNYAAYQRSLGYSGRDADGVPGETSLRKLLGHLPAKKSRKVIKPTVDLSLLRNAARRNPSSSGQPVTYSGVKHVEKALVREGYLSSRYADGHYGTSTVKAYAAWQRELGYRGSDADGIPGSSSLRKLGAKYGFRVKG